MNNAPQPQRTAEPDVALHVLGSLLATLHDASERDAILDALAMHILGERPRAPLALAITACAEK